MKLIIDVTKDQSGRYSAKCFSAGFQAEAKNLEELYVRIDGAIDRRFEGRRRPKPSDVHWLMSQA